MEVLKEGKGWFVKATCTGEGNGEGGCGALLKVEENDLFKTESYSWGEHETFVTFQCPVCKKYTDLDKSGVPYQVQSKLKLRKINI